MTRKSKIIMCLLAENQALTETVKRLGLCWQCSHMRPCTEMRAGRYCEHEECPCCSCRDYSNWRWKGADKVG